MKAFKTKLFGVDIDSSKQSAQRVQMLGQAALDKRWGANSIILQVDDLDDNHIKMTIKREFTKPQKPSALQNPEDIYQEDVVILFTDFAPIPDWGGYLNIICTTDNLLDYEIKAMQKRIKGSKITTFEVKESESQFEVLLAK